MAQRVIGRVGELWRYPVKSMAGEKLDRATLDPSGIVGDRKWAPVDDLSGEITNCKVIPSLLMCSARYTSPPAPGFAIAHTLITLPDGRSISTDDPFIAPVVSAIAGRPVSLSPLQPPTHTEHYRLRNPLSPDVMRQRMGLRVDDTQPDFSIYEPEMLNELQHFVTPRGSYKDAYPIHLITSASLATIEASRPGIHAEARRFRPSLVIETPDETGFPEHDWTGFDLIIGNVVIHCGPKTVRCSMPAQPQQGLVAEPHINAVFRRLTGFNLGAYAFVRETGTIAAGDEVILDTRPRKSPMHSSFPPIKVHAPAAEPPGTTPTPGPFKKLRVLSKTLDAEDVASFELGGTPLTCPRFAPGQHLTLRLKPSVEGPTLIRSYSISGVSQGGTKNSYKITVKRIGAASSYLHDNVQPGDELEVRWPTGRFFSLPTEETPLVLVSNGIGITPLFSMLSSAAENTPKRKIFWVHATRNGRSHIFKNAVEALSEKLEDFTRFIIYTRPDSDDIEGVDYHSTQYLQEQDLAFVAGLESSQLFLCGTPAFMSQVQKLARHHGIRDDQVFTELFGAPYNRTKGSQDDPATGTDTTTRNVRFLRSGTDAEWCAKNGTLLELAEELGIAIDYGCRFGACQACSVGLVEGQVAYPDNDIQAGPGKALLCCAKPLSDLVLDL